MQSKFGSKWGLQAPLCTKFGLDGQRPEIYVIGCAPAGLFGDRVQHFGPLKQFLEHFGGPYFDPI